MTKSRDLANAATALNAVTATEIGYVDGVTSAIQTQLNAKQAVVSGVNDTEIGYLDGVTSAIQTQLDAKTAKSTLTTTGDIYYASGANTPARLGIGSTGNVLTVASGIPSWAAPAAGSFVGCQVTTNATDQTVSNTVNHKVQFMVEDFDTDGFHDNSTNNTRITIPSGKGGYYFVYGLIHWLNSTAGRRVVYISKNNTTDVQAEGFSVATNTQYPALQVARVYNLVAGDYLELEAFQSTGGNLDLECDPTTIKFGVYKIG